MTLQDTIAPIHRANLTVLAHEIGEQLRPAVAERDASGEISREAFGLLRDHGVTKSLVPSDRGGGGATHAEVGEFLRVLGRYDAPTALTLSMHSHVVAAQVWRHHQGMDASTFFDRVVSGAIMVTSGASDWVGSSGAAVKVDGGYRVTARKMPISGCEVADVFVSSARVEHGPEGAEVIHFAAPFDAPGMAIEHTWNTLGMRATGSHTVVVGDVFVPDASVSLIRPADVWHPFWNTIVGAAMPLIMSPYVGIADAAVDAAASAISGRSDDHVSQVVGEMVSAHTAGADAVDAMFAASDNLRFANTDDHASRTLARKVAAADRLIESVRLAIEATGGLGFSQNSDLARMYRDVHGCLFHPISRAKQARFSGRVAAGLTPVGACGQCACSARGVPVLP